MKEQLFVTGIGTEIGKTVVSAVLTTIFESDYWKPVQSGDLDLTDSMKIAQWATTDGKIIPETHRFELAASPHQSAAAENVEIALSDFSLPKTEKSLIVEGAGGLYVPLSADAMMIDLIERLNLDIVLVAKDYLGAINHTLLSIEALKKKGVNLKYLVLNGAFNPESERIIINYIKPDTRIMRIPELKKITKKEIFEIAQNIKNKL